MKKEANYYVKQVSKLRLALKSEAQKLSQLVQDTDALRQVSALCDGVRKLHHRIIKPTLLYTLHLVVETVPEHLIC